MILARSIFLQLLPPYLMGVAILTFVLSMDTIYRLINLIVTKGVSVITVGLMLLYRMPQFLSVTLPLAMVIAIFIVMMRLSSDFEITAMRAAGMGFWRLARPVAFFGVLASLLTLLITLWIQPAGYAAFEQEQLKMLRSHTAKNIQPKVINYDFTDKILHVQDRQEDGELEGVFIADRTLKESSMVILSEQGQIRFRDQEIVLQLSHGQIHLTDKKPELYRTIAFERFDYLFKLPQIISGNNPHIWGQSTLALLQNEKHSAQLELALRLTTPWACLGFTLASIALGITDPRSGRSGTYLRALILIIVYYILWMGAKEIALDRKNSPQILWLPPTCIFLFGIYALHKVEYNLRNLKEVFQHLFRWNRAVTE